MNVEQLARDLVDAEQRFQKAAASVEVARTALARARMRHAEAVARKVHFARDVDRLRGLIAGRTKGAA